MQTPNPPAQSHWLYRGEDLSFLWTFAQPFMLHGFHAGRTAPAPTSGHHFEFRDTPPDIEELAIFVRELRIGKDTVWASDAFIPLYALAFLRFRAPILVLQKENLLLTVSKLERSHTEKTLLTLLPLGAK